MEGDALPAVLSFILGTTVLVGSYLVVTRLGILVIEARKQTALLKRLVEHAYGHEPGYLDD